MAPEAKKLRRKRINMTQIFAVVLAVLISLVVVPGVLAGDEVVVKAPVSTKAAIYTGTYANSLGGRGDFEMHVGSVSTAGVDGKFWLSSPNANEYSNKWVAFSGRPDGKGFVATGSGWTLNVAVWDEKQMAGVFQGSIASSSFKLTRQ
jgi:hypothetical protein